MAMSVEELQAWLTGRIGDITGFMDYESADYGEEGLADTLDSWFDTPRWRGPGHRFHHLGIDGTGSQVAAWVRAGSAADEPAPVVFFGSEGELSVLARRPLDWAFLLAHAPALWDMSAPMLSLREDEDERSKAALASYREGVENTFGAIPTFESLRDGVAPLDAELLAWVDGVLWIERVLNG